MGHENMGISSRHKQRPEEEAPPNNSNGLVGDSTALTAPKVQLSASQRGCGGMEGVERGVAVVCDGHSLPPLVLPSLDLLGGRDGRRIGDEIRHLPVWRAVRPRPFA
jgi:hypothetical protein